MGNLEHENEYKITDRMNVTKIIQIPESKFKRSDETFLPKTMIFKGTDNAVRHTPTLKRIKTKFFQKCAHSFAKSFDDASFSLVHKLS